MEEIKGCFMSKRLKDYKNVINVADDKSDDEEEISSCYSWAAPIRCYKCSFCKKELKSAQALGGHMNVHRREKVASKLITTQITITTPPRNYYYHYLPNFLHHPQSHQFLNYPNPNNANHLNSTCFANLNTSSTTNSVRYSNSCSCGGRLPLSHDHLSGDNYVRPSSKILSKTLESTSTDGKAVEFSCEKDSYGRMININVMNKSESGLLNVDDSHEQRDDLDLELRLGRMCSN